MKIRTHTPSALQRSFEFSTPHGMSLTIEHPLEALLARVLLIIIAIFALAYLYFVSASVLNVIARKEAITKIGVLQSVIGDVEQQYYVLTERITPDEADRLGLSPLKRTSYVYRPGTTAAVTMVNNEI